MRLNLFRRLMQQVPAIYYSDAPLFAFDEGTDAIVPKRFRSDTDGTELRFTARGRHYIMKGGSPETVTLIPVPGQEAVYIFQQSAGMGTAFYGALGLVDDHAGFLLFSPENAAAALDAAIGNGATATAAGYKFTRPAQLVTALVPVALEAPFEAWTNYRRV